MISVFDHLAWPFFDDGHRTLAKNLDEWCADNLRDINYADTFAACRELVQRLGKGGWLTYSVPSGDLGELGGRLPQLDSRSLCLIRETLGRHHALADFAFAMQGLGSGAISLAGNNALKQQYLPGVAAGQRIAAFALSEPDAGSGCSCPDVFSNAGW